MIRSIHPILVVFSLVIATSIAEAQHAPPLPRSISFRLFGADARPITKKSKAYSVRIRRRVSNTMMTIPHSWRANVVRYDTADMSILDMPQIMVVKGSDTMTISGSCGADSIRFSVGRYRVGPAYAKLMLIRRHAASLRPTLEEFRIDGDTSWMTYNAIDETLKWWWTMPTGWMSENPDNPNYYIDHLADIAYAPESRTFISIIGDPRFGWGIIRGESMGQQWKHVQNPFDKSSAPRVEAKNGEFVLYGNNGSPLQARSTDDGRSWMLEDAPTDSRPPGSSDTVEFSSGDAVAISRTNGLDRRDHPRILYEPWTLSRRSGKHGRWVKLLEGFGSPPVLRFHDDRLGILLTSQYMLVTRDAGASWLYRPFESRHPNHVGKIPWEWLTSIWTGFSFVDARTILAFSKGGAKLIPFE